MTKKIFAVLFAVLICISAVISASAYTSRYVVDYTEKLASSELEELEAFAGRIEDTYGICIMFCIVDGTDEASDEERALKTYMDNTDNDSGVVLLHNDSDDTYCQIISGMAKSSLPSNILDNMLEAYKMNESYFGGIYACYEVAEEYLSAEHIPDEEPAFGDEAPEEKNGVSIIWLPVSLAIGILVGFLIIGAVASKNKSVRMQKDATVYTRQGSMVITGSADNFLYNDVERKEKPKQENKN